MIRLKFLIVLVFAAAAVAGACGGGPKSGYVLADNRSYEATLFRQNCAICHGPEGEGRTLDNGTVVPSLRKGEFKSVTEEQIYKQIAEGGNGMLPFRRQLSDREIKLLVTMVKRDLRGQ